MFARLLTITTALVSLSGCVSHVYQPYNLLSGGFSEKKVSEKHYSVQYKGNSNLKLQKTLDFTLLRAAVIAHKSGAPSFMSSQVNAKTTYVHGQYGTSETTDATVDIELLSKNVRPSKSGCWIKPPKTEQNHRYPRFIHDTASCIEELKEKLDLTDDQIYRESQS